MVSGREGVISFGSMSMGRVSVLQWMTPHLPTHIQAALIWFQVIERKKRRGHEPGRRIGWGGLGGVWGGTLDIISIQCVHVWNSQRINLKYCIKGFSHRKVDATQNRSSLMGFKSSVICSFTEGAKSSTSHGMNSLTWKALRSCLLPRLSAPRLAHREHFLHTLKKTIPKGTIT